MIAIINKVKESKVKNKYIHILNFWNLKEIIKHYPLKPILKQVKMAYKKHGKDKIIKDIKNC